jgi:hypothetical protein
LFAVGLVIYIGTLLIPEPTPDFYEDAERPEIRLSQEALEVVQQEFATLAGRPLTSAEEQKVVKWAVNQEILHDYALRLGIDSTEAARERLARVGEFLNTEHDAHGSKEDMVEKALDLGMSKRDPVTRKILIDSVTRLIKAGALVQPIDESKLSTWFDLHKEQYMLPRRTRISHVMLSRNVNNKTIEELEADARTLLNEIVSVNLSMAEAIARGNTMFVPNHFDLITDKDYARQLGHKFPEYLAQLPLQQWSGPVASRYGQHLVYVHERVESQVPALADVRQRVVNDYRQYEANLALEARLDELRNNYDIYVKDQPWIDGEKIPG